MDRDFSSCIPKETQWVDICGSFADCLNCHYVDVTDYSCQNQLFKQEAAATASQASPEMQGKCLHSGDTSTSEKSTLHVLLVTRDKA